MSEANEFLDEDVLFEEDEPDFASWDEGDLAVYGELLLETNDTVRASHDLWHRARARYRAKRNGRIEVQMPYWPRRPWMTEDDIPF